MGEEIKKEETTTLTITRDIKAKLDEFGKKGETYSEVIDRLFEGYGKKLQ